MAFRYAGTGWRVAGSIRQFGEQIHQLRGHRISYTVDGTLGDADHSNRVSDHNPDDDGIVRALDFYEDKPGRVDAVAEALRVSRDPRLKYFIHDDRMFSSYPTSTYPAWTWRSYGGVNGHHNHGHLSVVADSRAEQDHPWTITRTSTSQGDIDMSIIITALRAQNVAFYRKLKAITGNPGGNADYWGVDYQGTPKPSDAEWKEAAPTLLASALEAGVLSPKPSASGVTLADVEALINGAEVVGKVHLD